MNSTVTAAVPSSSAASSGGSDVVNPSGSGPMNSAANNYFSSTSGMSTDDKLEVMMQKIILIEKNTQRIDDIDNRTRATDQRTSRIENQQERIVCDMNNMKSALDANKKDVGWVTNQYQSLVKEMEKIQIDRTKGNVKMFNVQEDHRFGRENCKRTVVKLLDEHYRDCEWATDDIEAAFRLGKAESSRGARPLLIKFKQVDKARTVLGHREGRESLSKAGIKVAQERTVRQEELLRHLRSEGKHPYIFRGKVCFREAPSDQNNPLNADRRFRRNTNPKNSNWSQNPVRSKSPNNNKTAYDQQRLAGRGSNVDTDRQTHSPTRLAMNGGERGVVREREKKDEREGGRREKDRERERERKKRQWR